MTYEWREWISGDERWRGLLPKGCENNFSLERIASIYRRGDGFYVSSYHYPVSTGWKQGASAVHKTVRGAQRWIESQLDRFWEPPNITNRVVAREALPEVSRASHYS
jgi:hypothetical protein